MNKEEIIENSDNFELIRKKSPYEKQPLLFRWMFKICNFVIDLFFREESGSSDLFGD